MNSKTSEDIHVGFSIISILSTHPLTITSALKTLHLAMIIRSVRKTPLPLKCALLAVFSKLRRLVGKAKKNGLPELSGVGRVSNNSVS